MIGVVLTSFLVLDLDETFGEASQGYFEDPDCISSPIKNIPLLQDFRKRLLEVMQSLDKLPDVGS